jgi:hypothetical protein
MFNGTNKNKKIQKLLFFNGEKGVGGDIKLA